VAGPNGCGKTTLLRILCGLRVPDQGVVRWQGADIAEDAEEFRASLVFVAFQSGLKLDLSPRENLQYAAAVGASGTDSIDTAIGQALQLLGIADWADVACAQLSAGQVRRAALARLLVQRAGLWILDEPLTGLDREARATVEALMFKHAEQGGTVIFTTHHPLSGHHAGLRLLELSA
jgi:heme exporter protein A